MLIQLTDEYRITGEHRNIVLEQLVVPKPDKDGTQKAPYWRAVAYYGRLEHALEAVLDRQIEGAPTEDIEGLKRFVLGVKNDLVRAVQGGGQSQLPF